jgi:formiminoglutamase
MNPDWLEVHQGTAPLVVSFPHTGTEIPEELARRYVSLWRARRDADWWVDKLYGLAADLGCTTVRTRISRSVIDVNRDPSGASLYPGQATTELCPTTDFDGDPLYRRNETPSEDEIARRRDVYFRPYHGRLRAELDRLRVQFGRVVLFDAHSIRSRIPRLFEGMLPHFNIGTNDGRSCAAELTAAVEKACGGSHFSRVVNGRFKGGWTTRHYGEPSRDIHAIQLELACRGYMDEPEIPDERNWPPAYSETRAAELRAVLTNILAACREFALRRAPA